MASLTPYLEAQGWRVRYAADGDSATRLADAGFDAAVVDMMLPRGGGFRLVHHLRARVSPAVPVIMVSEFDAPEHRAYAAIIGVTAFLPKPFALDHLLGLLGQLLARPS
ncbi:MAG: response regulator [Fimbriiglobus sp.]|nr:response regulator [Fimbriiglobus sp.]